MYQRTVVAMLFLSSILMPPQAVAQSRTISRDQKKSVSSKKRNTPIKRNADLDGPLSVQPGANPDGKGGVTLVPATSGAAVGAGATSTGGSTAMASSGSSAKGIPVTVTRATGENGSLILGYTPQATPTPTPAPSDNSGIMMAAAGLAAVFAALAGGGGNKGKDQTRSAASNVGTSASGESPGGSIPAGVDTRQPPPSPKDNPSGPPESVSEPVETPSGSEKATKGDPLVVPTPKPEKTSPAADDQGRRPPASEVCKNPGSKPDRNSFPEEYLMPHDLQSGADFEVVLCNRLNLRSGKKDRDGTPLVVREILVGSTFEQPKMNENRLYTEMSTLNPEPVFPPMEGEISLLECPKSAGRKCVIHIKHKKCPEGAKSATCTSVFRNITMTEDQEADFKRRFNSPEGSSMRKIYPCETIGKNIQERGFYNKDSKMFTNRSYFAIFGQGENGVEEPIPPLVGFKDWQKVSNFSKERNDLHNQSHQGRDHTVSDQCQVQAEKERRRKSVSSETQGDAPTDSRPAAPKGDRLDVIR